MNEFGPPTVQSISSHQRWLFAQLRDGHAELRASLVFIRELTEQSRKAADEAWRLLQRPVEALSRGPPPTP